MFGVVRRYGEQLCEYHHFYLDRNREMDHRVDRKVEPHCKVKDSCSMLHDAAAIDLEQGLCLYNAD